MAAEALATGVVPLESPHRHATDNEIPGDRPGPCLRAIPTTASPATPFVGDETPVGDMPSPDHNQVDDIGRAMGVQEEDSGALCARRPEILARRDQARGYLDEGPDPRRAAAESFATLCQRSAVSRTAAAQRTESTTAGPAPAVLFF